MTLLVKPEAEAEISEACAWYETQITGLGSEFLQAVDVCFSVIQRNPMLFPIVHKKIHRALLRKFPYGIFYITAQEKVVILACFHCRRNPRRWRSKK